MPMNALNRAINAAGGQTALARKIGVTQSHVWYWLRRADGRVPSARVAAIVTACDGAVTAHELRPDVFHESEASPSSIAAA